MVMKSLPIPRYLFFFVSRDLWSQVIQTVDMLSNVLRSSFVTTINETCVYITYTSKVNSYKLAMTQVLTRCLICDGLQQLYGRQTRIGTGIKQEPGCRNRVEINKYLCHDSEFIKGIEYTITSSTYLNTKIGG